MEIIINKRYRNKTWRYLLPCLRGHGQHFIDLVNEVMKLAVGVHDTLLDGSPMSQSRNVYILCDKKERERFFYRFLDYARRQNYYVTDYCPDSNIKSRKHMVVIKVPAHYNGAYDHFLKGEYSKMYSKRELEILFGMPTRRDDYQVLAQTTDAMQDFIAVVAREYGTILQPKDLIGAEYDLPLKRCEEVFHCDKSENREFFQTSLDKQQI